QYAGRRQHDEQADGDSPTRDAHRLRPRSPICLATLVAPSTNRTPAVDSENGTTTNAFFLTAVRFFRTGSEARYFFLSAALSQAASASTITSGSAASTSSQ